MVAQTDQKARRELTKQEREEMRTGLIGENAQNALAFQTKAVRKFGSDAGIFIRQLIFWDGDRSDAGGGWLWKSRREMERETGLNQKRQENARKILVAAGILEEDERPVGPLKRKTMHYRPDLLKLMDIFDPAPVSGTGHGANEDFSPFPSEETHEEAVSGTGYGENEGNSPYLSAKPPEQPVSGTGHGSNRPKHRYIRAKPPRGAMSGIQESTSGENEQEKEKRAKALSKKPDEPVPSVDLKTIKRPDPQKPETTSASSPSASPPRMRSKAYPAGWYVGMLDTTFDVVDPLVAEGLCHEEIMARCKEVA